MSVNCHAYNLGDGVFGEEGCLLSSDDEGTEDEGDSNSGHPIEPKSAILENLRNGFAYHKNGPAREYDWTKDEIAEMSKLITDTHEKVQAATKNKSRVIRAQNYKGESSANMLRNWVNSCLDGKRFPDNPSVERGSKLEHDEWTNHQLWEYVSRTLQAEFHYWTKVEKINRSLPDDRKKEIKYPTLDDLIFRHNDDFTAGLWSDFSQYWQPFIDELSEEDTELKREIRESLEHGIDLVSHVDHIPIGEAKVWRTVRGKEIKVFTKPFIEPEYTEQRLGRRDYSKEKNCKFNSVCGYTPRIVQLEDERKDVFYYPTGGKNLRFMHVICSQLMSWIKQNCVNLLGTFDLESKDYEIEAILPFIIEWVKPRTCIDGSPFTLCAPKPKPPCVLDNAADFLRLIKQYDCFSVIDDQSGFLQARINPISQRFCRLQFHDLCLTHRGMAFGLHVSPPFFQNLNRVAVAALNSRGFPTLLYLDDRAIIERLKRELEPGETGCGVYSLLCLLVSFGGFISRTKCDFVPKRNGRFLGFDFDTIQQTVTVPKEKHKKVCRQIERFIKNAAQTGKCDMKLLERIRGRIISWCLVCVNYGFFTRELNLAIKEHYARFDGPVATENLMDITKVTNYEFLVGELRLWQKLDYVKLTRKWISEQHHNFNESEEVYTDASGFGLGSAREVKGVLRTRKFPLPLALAGKPIHVKEAYVILIDLQSRGIEFDGCRLCVWCDNVAVVESWEGTGTRNIDMARIFAELCKHCQRHNIYLTLKWISTKNQKADAPSRELTHVFSRTKKRITRPLLQKLGVNIDVFAGPGDAIGEDVRFYSEYPFPKAAGIDGLTYSYKEGDVPYAYAPRVLRIPFLTGVVPHCSKMIMLRHLYGYNNSNNQLYESLFDYYQVIGCRKNSACITPCSKKENTIPYFRDYSECHETRLYFRGFRPSELRAYLDEFRTLEQCDNYNDNVGGMSNKQESTYTNRIKGNFYTLTIPHYIRGTKEAASTEQETRDLTDRRRQKEDLLKARGDTSAAYTQAQRDLDDFQRRVHEFRQANNVKNPTTEDRRLIATVTQSVSSIRLTGPSYGVSDIDRRIAAHATVLVKKRDETMAAWNDAGKKYDDTEKIIKNLEQRLQMGSHGREAISGGRMRCLPGFSGASAIKPFPETVRDLWQLLEGPNILSLQFDAILRCIETMRKSVNSWCNDSTLNKDEHARAMCCRQAVEEVHGVLTEKYARATNKRDLVNTLSILAFSPEDQDLLARNMARQTSGLSRRVMDSPCTDCLGGCTMGQVMQEFNHKHKKNNQNGQNGQSGNRRGGHNGNQGRGNRGQDNQSNGQGNGGGNGRRGKNQNGRPNDRNGRNQGQNQHQNQSRDNGQSGSSGNKSFYCPNHGHGNHDFNFCFYNPNGKNFKKEKYDKWVSDGKPSLTGKN